MPILKGKDKQKTMKKLVYSIRCLNSDKVYIGRIREKRMAEHRAKIKTFGSDSRIVEHTEDQKHSSDFTRVTTLTFENNWQKKTIKENLLTNKTLGNAINDTKYKPRIFG